MLLNQLFSPKKLFEGGNLASHKADGQPMPGWQGIPGQHQAQELDLNVHNRTEVVAVLSDLLHGINDAFAQQFKEPLWHENSVKAQKFLSGSTMRFFDKKISDEEFVRVKPTVGDIDTQAPDKHEGTIKQFLTGLIGKKVGNAKFIGFSAGNNQYTSMWEVLLKDLPVKLQIDFEYGAHDPKTGLPTPWQEYSHSSSWEDLSAGIKGVFHKYIDRALPYASTVSTKYVARVLKKSTKISDEPVTDSDYSFAVSGQGGGGVSRKYVPYNDPATGAPMERDGIPVMQLLDPANRQYIQNLGQQFEIFFGRKPKGNDQQLKNSFVGTVELANKYLDDQQRTELFNRFVSICFEPGSQMITKGDPARDRNIKMAAIDYMIQNMKLANPQGMRKQAIKTAMDYEQAFTSKQAGKGLNEAEVKAQFRKNMPHLKDLKPIDFLDLLDELDQGNGQFKLKNIPLNVKVDGFGGRFGKNSDGQPFMATSRTEPRYQAGFVDYHQKKGTTDPEILGRAQLFDDLFAEMMSAVQLVDSKLGPDFLINKQVTCEVLYLPFASETPEGKLKFVGIHYDKLPQGVQLALVPFRVTDATTGEDLPESNKIVKELTSVGRQGSVMFIDNSLTQNEELDVTEIINVLDNIEELKQIVSDTAGKRDRASLDLRRQVEEKLQPVKLELEKAIINDPNIIGKDLLGKDYEGIVINSRLGPIKITSQEQRDVISAKNAAKVSARTEQPRANSNKTAVVAIGSFIGHKGHEELWDYTVKKAQQVGGDPYLFIGNAEGKDDPIPPSVKVQTWHKLYPEYAKNISTVQEGGQLIQKIKHELINPLPGKPPRYDNIIIMVGEDRAGMNMPNALMKAVNKFQGYEHVKVSLDVTPRGTGISGTALRNSLKNDPPEKALATWSNAFDVNKLGVDWIKHLMDITRKGMGIQQTQPQQPAPQPAPVAEMRLFNALVAPKHKFVEGQLELNTPNPVVVVTDTKTGKILDTINLNIAAQKYRLGNPQNVKNQLAHQSYTTIGNYTISAPMGGQPQDQTTTGQKNTFATVEGGIATVGWPDDDRNVARDKPVDIGGVSMKQLSVGDQVNYFGNKARLLALSQDRKRARIHMPERHITQNVDTADLTRVGQGDYANKKPLPRMAEGKEDKIAQLKKDYDTAVHWSKNDTNPHKREAARQTAEKIKAHLEKQYKQGVAEAMSAGERMQRALQREKERRERNERAGQELLNPKKKEEPKEKGVAEGGAKYKVKVIGQDKKGEYYVSPSTGEKVYKKARVGDHEVPGSKEIKPKLEAMLPKTAFAGSDKNKLGPDAHLKGTTKRGARAGDLVGEGEESREYVYQGHKIKFTPTQLVITKGPNVALTRPGDFSNPTKQNLISAKSYIDKIWQKDKEQNQSPNISHQHDLYGTTKEYQAVRDEIDKFLIPFEKERDELRASVGNDRTAWISGLEELWKKYHRSPQFKELDARRSSILAKLTKLRKGSSWKQKQTNERVAVEPEIHDKVEEKIKGADGKACWDGYRYNGTENGSDKCVKIGEAWELEMSHAISKLFENR